MPTLRSRQDFGRLQATGRTLSHRLMTVRFVRNDHGFDRFGIATGRHLGKAVTRNRVRRRIREILRRRPERDGAGWDILIIARPASAVASFGELREALERLLLTVHRGAPSKARS